MSINSAASLKPRKGATMRAMADPVGVLEIARRLGVKDRTAHMWGFRKVLPDPEYAAVNGGRAWEWSTILRWAGDTGRLRDDDQVKEYRRLTGKDPHPLRGAVPVSE